jgi:hypothetical protein
MKSINIRNFFRYSQLLEKNKENFSLLNVNQGLSKDVEEAKKEIIALIAKQNQMKMFRTKS